MVNVFLLLVCLILLVKLIDEVLSFIREVKNGKLHNVD